MVCYKRDGRTIRKTYTFIYLYHLEMKRFKTDIFRFNERLVDSIIITVCP